MGFLGEDSFTYRATNGTQRSLPILVTITVVPDPNMPVSEDDNYQGDMNAALVVNVAEGVLANDSDPNMDPLTALLFSDVSNGTLNLASNGSFTYTPDIGFYGMDQFRYQAFDGGIASVPSEVTIIVKQPVGTGYLVAPAPGSIYKEFTRIMSTNSNQWRVTDPSATNPGSPGNAPSTYLPNDVMPLTVNDLTGAIRAEAIMDVWGGHVGTVGKQLIVNGNSPISIPDVPTIPSNPECYVHQYNVTVEVPLADLVQGTNTIEGDSGGQTCFNFNWGQWGWYAITLRIYYDESKPHPTGMITSPTVGDSFDEDPIVTATATSPAGIDKVEFYAFYDGYDTDGDGRYLDYHYNRHRRINEFHQDPRDHVGTVTTFPYEVTWDTELVPDQAPGSVRLIARIRDGNGVWYVTPEVGALSLARTMHSVTLYKPYNIPQSYWVRDGMQKSSNFNIPAGGLTDAVDAKLLVKTWNGIDGQTEPGETNFRQINSWDVPEFGQDHFYSYDIVDVPVSELQIGTNTYTVQSTTVHHGIEMVWPGPAVLVRRTLPNVSAGGADRPLW